MKTTLTIAILFLFLTQAIFGQSEPRLHQQNTSITYSSQDNFQKFRESTYEYNELGDYKSIISKSYNDQEELVNWIGTFYTYNNENLLTKKLSRRYNSDVDLWISIGWNEYEYDNNGCLIFDTEIENIGGLFSETRYERNTDCQMTKEMVWFENSDTLVLQYIKERTYFQDGISYQEVRSEPKAFLDNAIVIKRISDNYFHPNGNLDVVYTTFNDNNGDYKYDGKYTFEYDQFDNLTSYTLHRKDSMITDWTLLYYNFYDLEYDDDNRMIEKKSGLEDYTFDPPLIHEGNVEGFEYWCKDLVKTNIVDIGNGFAIYKYDFFYEGKNECFEPEKELLEIDVFPNPTSGMITINSLIFQSGDTQITVFDMHGKLLLEKNENRQLLNAEIDLVDFPNGMYVIQLMNQEHFVQHKIVLTK